MGKSAQGRTKYEGDVELLTKDQKRFLSDILKKETKGARKAYSDLLERPEEPDMMSRKEFEKFLKPSRKTYEDLMNVGTDEAAFKTGVVDPMMQQYNQQVLPSLQQRFIDMNAGSSSALNQALASSANDLTTQMGSMYLPFMQNQQQTRLAAAQGLTGMASPYLGYMGQQSDLYKTALGGRQAALAGLSGLAGQQTFQPILSQKEGWLGPTIGAAGSALGGWMMSSEKIKENIRDYDKGLGVIKNLDVKIYDYKPEAGGAKNRVGVIAEHVPEEISAEIKGIKAVDLYGLIGLLINSVKELNKKVEKLEEKDAASNRS